MASAAVVATAVAASSALAVAAWVGSRWASPAYRSETLEEQGLSAFESLVTVRNSLSLNRLLCPHPTSSDTVFVLIHGFGGQVRQWAPLVHLLAAYGTVLAIDAVGHGKSKTSANMADHTSSQIVADLLAVFDASEPAKAAKNVVIVGHSYGCALSVILANELKARSPTIALKGLILLAPKSTQLSKDEQLKKLVDSVPLPGLWLLRFMDTFSGGYSSSVNRMYHKADLTTRMRQLRWNQTTPSTTVKFTAMGMSLPGPEKYAAIECPILIVYGEHDHVTSREPEVDNIVKWASSAHITIRGLPTSHHMLWEATKETTDFIEAFLHKQDVVPQ
ncbi:Alpha/Beta hydrolase protein [Entophlyctis helioformis]|nr:Alpha/Beta hydrolase protein [Entophlyctis helioformis]